MPELRTSPPGSGRARGLRRNTSLLTTTILVVGSFVALATGAWPAASPAGAVRTAAGYLGAAASCPGGVITLKTEDY
jgi:hypothetical protein